MKKTILITFMLFGFLGLNALAETDEELRVGFSLGISNTYEGKLGNINLDTNVDTKMLYLDARDYGFVLTRLYYINTPSKYKSHSEGDLYFGLGLYKYFYDGKIDIHGLVGLTPFKIFNSGNIGLTYDLGTSYTFNDHFVASLGYLILKPSTDKDVLFDNQSISGFNIGGAYKF